MPHWGILTNGRFSIREDYILMLVEVKELHVDLFSEEVTEAEVLAESEISADILVEFVLECELVGGDQ